MPHVRHDVRREAKKRLALSELPRGDQDVAAGVSFWQTGHGQVADGLTDGTYGIIALKGAAELQGE